MKLEVYGNPNDKTENVDLFYKLLEPETGHSHQKDLENMESDSNLVVIGRIGIETLANLHILYKTKDKDNLGFIFLADKPSFEDNQNAIEELASITGRTVIYAPDGVQYQINPQGPTVHCMAIDGNFMEATPDENNLAEIKNYGSSIRFGPNQQELDNSNARIAAICASLGESPKNLSVDTLSSLVPSGESPDNKPLTSKRSSRFKIG